MKERHFITGNDQDETESSEHARPNGWLLFVACDPGAQFATRVKKAFESESGTRNIPLLGADGDPVIRRFPDTETCARFPVSVAGADAYVFQCAHTHTWDSSVNENIQELLQTIRTLKTHRARTITAVLPYSPYARQDKPSFMEREASLAKLFVDQLKTAGADAYLTYHPHTYALYGFCEPHIRFVPLDGIHLMADIFSEYKKREDTIAVCTDAGGAKFVVKFANILGIDYAIASKFRSSGRNVESLGVIGPLENKRIAILIDDETVTGGSLLGVASILHEQFHIQNVQAAVSHFKAEPESYGRFAEAHRQGAVSRLHITDTIPHAADSLGEYVEVHSVVDRFAAAIDRLHFNRSVSQLFTFP